MVADPENCHALSRSDHEQRFNVAASRARERMYLVHSVTRDHISPKDLRLNLLNHFYDLQEDQKASFEAIKLQQPLQQIILNNIYFESLASHMYDIFNQEAYVKHLIQVFNDLYPKK
jgi:hypothetical protein